MKPTPIELWEHELDIITSALWDRIELLRSDGEPPTDKKIEEIVEVSDVTHKLFKQFINHKIDERGLKNRPERSLTEV